MRQILAARQTVDANPGRAVGALEQRDGLVAHFRPGVGPETLLQPWADRLLVLPEFLSPGARLAADRDSMEQAFLLTGYFFERHVYEPRGIAMPDSRSGFVHAALKAMTHTHATD